MSFYPDVKDGLSPSAIAQWFNSRGSFVKSYFVGERGPTTKAMKGGTEIHALIEAGIIKAKHVYKNAEVGIDIELAPGRVFRGRPDSFEGGPRSAWFVDYKSGKANEWAEKLPTDIKMRATAWLVWKEAGEPGRVEGFIEFIQTTWDPELKKVVPIDDKETEVVSITYSDAEMKSFTQVILKAMDEIDTFYEVWKKSTGDFVNKQDVMLYAETKQQIDDLKMRLDDIAERIETQMEFGGEETHKTNVGTFFFKTTETYEYPPELEFSVNDEDYTLEKADKIDAAARAAMTNYRLINEPKTTKRSVNFRAKTEK